MFDVELIEKPFVKFRLSVSKPVERMSIPSPEPDAILIEVAAEPIMPTTESVSVAEAPVASAPTADAEEDDTLSYFAKLANES